MKQKVNSVTHVPEHLISELKKRLLKKRIINNETGCWEWKDKTEPNGYARIYMRPYRWAVHRASCWIFNGPFPLEAYICHACDNRKCFNPDHLYVGSHKTNMEDMKKRGRACSGDDARVRKYPKTIKRGEDCHWASLTERQVIMLKELYKIYPSISSIAKFTKIHRKTISDIINKHSWRHLNEDS